MQQVDENNLEFEFSFSHKPKRINGEYDLIMQSSFPMREKSRISSIYVINVDFNNTDTISLAYTYTKNDINDNICLLHRTVETNKQLGDLPQKTKIVLRLLINVNTGKFVFSLSDNSKEVNNNIEKVRVNLVYKLEDTYCDIKDRK